MGVEDVIKGNARRHKELVEVDGGAESTRTRNLLPDELWTWPHL
jgi:hypothetical protein